jgi:glycine cleavage system T protein
MREHADVVIIGAGIVGCSAAYHLAKLGRHDIVVLDQGPLFATGGSSSHAPGLMFQLNASRTVTQLARYSASWYADLLPPDDPACFRVGSFEVATTLERWQELKRKLGHAMSWGLEAHLISPREAAEHVPMLCADRLYGALYVPSDGAANAVRVAEAAARAAEGAAFYGETQVTGIEVANGRVRAVVTDKGRIATETVLLCAGIWGPAIGRMAGVPIPLIPVQHQYARTAPLPALAGETIEIRQPFVRHQDRRMYFRQHGDCWGIGSYLHEPLLVDVTDIPRHADQRMPSVLPFTESDFGPAWEAAVDLFPCLRDATLTSTINGMFSFTPDGQSLLGPSLDVQGFWVAEAVWVTHAGGVGRVMAEWMVEGVPSVDLREGDYNRFAAHVAAPTYIRARGAQQYREVYDIIHPLQQLEHPRGLRRGPFHPRLEALGAAFFESAGWERPQWFQANEPLPRDYDGPVRSGWAARYWSPIALAEHMATRDRVAMYDLTAFTKVQVGGPGALAYLQRLACNQMDTPVGKVTYTAMLNDRGGIQCDVTVTRLADDRFLVVTGGSVGMHDAAWMRQHLPADSSVILVDKTSALCCVGLWGPRARQVLRSVCEDDLSNEALPYFSARHIFVGTVPVLAVRVSYVGEPGWELYAPTEYGLLLWDTLWEAGQAAGVIAAGGAAFDSLRLEKGYRLWGADIHTDYNPFEAGLGFAVRLQKGDFIGRDALLRIKETGPARRLRCLVFDDPTVVVMGKEPLLVDGQTAGYVTSANYGPTVRRSIAYGYLPSMCGEGSMVDVQYFGERYGARVAREPLYDPRGDRLRHSD